MVIEQQPKQKTQENYVFNPEAEKTTFQIRINRAKKRVLIDGKAVEFEDSEIGWELFLRFAQNSNRDLSSDALRIVKVKGTARNDVGMSVWNLRKNIEKDPRNPEIITRSGSPKKSFYRMNAEVEFTDGDLLPDVVTPFPTEGRVNKPKPISFFPPAQVKISNLTNGLSSKDTQPKEFSLTLDETYLLTFLFRVKNNRWLLARAEVDTLESDEKKIDDFLSKLEKIRSGVEKGLYDFDNETLASLRRKMKSLQTNPDAVIGENNGVGEEILRKISRIEGYKLGMFLDQFIPADVKHIKKY